MKKAIVFIIILAALCGGGYYGYESGLIEEKFPGLLEKIIPGYEAPEPEGRVSSDAENAVFVDSVSVLAGLGSGSGQILRFAGKVEPQETVTYDLDSERTVGECYVKTGDNVKEDQKLFSYDTTEEEQELAQAEIDLERLKNTHNTSEVQLEELKKTYESEATAENELEVLTAQNELKQNVLDQEAKQKEIDGLKDKIKDSVVYCDVDGVVQSVNDGDGSSTNFQSGEEESYIKVLKTGTYRIKGTANEQNISMISAGMRMIVFSRMDKTQFWHGAISEISTDQGGQEDSSMFGSSSGSTNYNFYVELDDSEGLILGQHIYMEEDLGQENSREGIWLNDYYFVTDPDGKKYVWAADSKNLLTKREVTLGGHDDSLAISEVLTGLDEDDYICEPNDDLEEGLPVNYNNPGEASVTDGAASNDLEGGFVNMDDLGADFAGGEVYDANGDNVFPVDFSDDDLLLDQDGFFDGDLTFSDETEGEYSTEAEGEYPTGDYAFTKDAGLPSFEGDLVTSADDSLGTTLYADDSSLTDASGEDGLSAVSAAKSAGRKALEHLN